jgi:hypothetical protein
MIPKRFKKTGLRMILNGQKQGLILFLLAKVLWWFIFLQIGAIWFSNYAIFLYSFTVIMATFQLYKDRRYLAYGLKRKTNSN